MAVVIKPQEEEKQEQKASILKPQKQAMVCWYHQDDVEFLRTLEPHLHVLEQQFNLQVAFFGYTAHRIGPSKEESQYSDTLGLSIKNRKEKELREYMENYYRTLDLLEKPAAVFLPCISPAFVMRFWLNVQESPKLGALMSSHSWPIVPISIHPIAAFNPRDKVRPLVAYEGYERESACALIAAEIEATLRKKHQPTEGHLSFLPTLKRRRWFF